MEKNIVALTENELENISGGKNSSSEFNKGFSRTIGQFCASLVIGAPIAILAVIIFASSR